MISALDLDSLAAFKEIIVEGNVIDSIHHELDSMVETNVILIPSIEKDFVIDLLTKLNAIRDSNIVVFGMPDWVNFKELNYEYLMNLDVHLPNSGILSYQDSLINISYHYQEIQIVLLAKDLLFLALMSLIIFYLLLTNMVAFLQKCT